MADEVQLAALMPVAAGGPQALGRPEAEVDQLVGQVAGQRAELDHALADVGGHLARAERQERASS